MMRKTIGSHYHWILVLYERLGLPFYKGIEEALESYGRLRDRTLENFKQEDNKKKRIQWKVKRELDSEKRKLWSKQHRDDTYGPQRKVKRKVKSEGGDTQGKKKLCQCGSNKHSKTSHRDCPLNKRHKPEEKRKDTSR